MSKVHERPPTAVQQYAKAYSTHYTGRDLLAALRAYGELIASHPSAVQAGYARAQLQNIVNLVVPADELMTSQMALAVQHLERVGDDTVAAHVP